MSIRSSAVLCALVWMSIMLWLAAPIGGANAILALVGGLLAGAVWYEERAAKMAMKRRDDWRPGGGVPSQVA
ncbi:MAG: hypothetical protein U1E81_04785 [Xanthobacteraceae bacterium]